MLRQRLLPVLALSVAIVSHAMPGFAAESADAPTFDLTARLKPGAAAEVSTTLEVGGELILPAKADAEETKVPLNVTAKFAYLEQILAWSADPSNAARSVRRYSEAAATIKTESSGIERTLPADRRVVIAEVTENGSALGGLEAPLKREEFDLIDVEGNTLVLDRLLPGKSLKEGEGWDHDAEVMGELLGMDHVAVCEVRSVVTGEEKRQVQIRMAGTVQGTVDGAAAELEVQAAYLYHLDRGRISKFNLAIKQNCKPGEVTSGFDVVARLSVVVAPASAAKQEAFDKATLQKAAGKETAELRELLVDSQERGYRIRHDKSWYVINQQRELMSLRFLDEGEFLAHCNVITSPPRPADKPKTLAEFEKEVCTALGAKVGKVAAATEWTTPSGHKCLGVFVDGSVNDVEMQWRYYNIAGPSFPQATVSVTVEQAVLERFADADRQLVDSLELVAPPAKTAAVDSATPK